MRPELPTGTVTFLLTDVEGSTALLHELGAGAYAETLGQHRAVIRGACAENGGVEVDTQGDAFFFAFRTASDALAAASDLTERLTASGPIRVRIGVHTGTPLVGEEGYVGLDVHRAARVMAAAHGGQVLVSETTRQLVDSSVALRDLGDHRLKDLTAPQRLYQLGEDRFPPPRSLHRTNLPIQPSPLIGRERELVEAGALLRSHRVVTLTGPGGSGKTRLALQLAAEAVDDLPDGVFWVPLQALRDPARVAHAIATSLGTDDELVQHLGAKRLLVLLDNFEQLIEAAPIVASIVSSTPNARFLITSREPLHVDSEQRYSVEPLPDDDAAVLFVERARGVRPGFRATPAVAEICRRIDGLPLAIELAAARVSLLDPEELLARLGRSLPLLTSRSRDAPERQKTLRATIGWSYDLLEPGEQQLFQGLAVFRGSFSLEAAEAICGANIDTLESLVVKSLVRRWDSGRLGLLDTIREYSLELLEESEQADEIRRGHAEFFLSVAKSANLNAGLPKREQEHIDIALLEQDNIRGAIAWALRNGSVQLGLELAVAMEQFWTLDDPREGMRWFERLLERPESATIDIDVRGHALRAYGSSAGLAGHWEMAESLFEQSLTCFEQLGDEHGRAVLLHRLGITAILRGDLERADELVRTSDQIHARTGDVWGRAQTVGTLGAIARDRDDERGAFELIEQSAEMSRQAGVAWWRAGMLAELAQLLLNDGRADEGEASARESLAIADELRDRSGRIFGVGLLARAAAERGDCEKAGRLWGAIEHEDAHAPLGGWRRHRDLCEERIRKAGGPAFDRGYALGRKMRLEEAVADALIGGG
ncbi:MAG: hypothetical protein LH654_00365 [Thermoleophilia bacterium]|nr:hypothetical protein [Thermoleophilia bacterium]